MWSTFSDAILFKLFLQSDVLNMKSNLMKVVASGMTEINQIGSNRADNIDKS